jgi:hypothetical protein
MQQLYIAVSKRRGMSKGGGEEFITDDLDREAKKTVTSASKSRRNEGRLRI